ncbi:DUF2905 domain-containing protein [Pseudonocardia sp. CA-142604]|uniref:DUF2905 domain-containing protein n=1 Tax=Pseudonocardia sp. CA-142604 TaxID=3240024 RepID=UPI003D925490
MRRHSRPCRRCSLVTRTPRAARRTSTVWDSRLLTRASSLLSWLGHLPADIRIVSGNTRIYIPITSMLLVCLP